MWPSSRAPNHAEFIESQFVGDGGDIPRGIQDPALGVPGGFPVTGAVVANQPDSETVQDAGPGSGTATAPRGAMQQEDRVPMRGPFNVIGDPVLTVLVSYVHLMRHYCLRTVH